MKIDKISLCETRWKGNNGSGCGVYLNKEKLQTSLLLTFHCVTAVLVQSKTTCPDGAADSGDGDPFPFTVIPFSFKGKAKVSL